MGRPSSGTAAGAPVAGSATSRNPTGTTPDSGCASSRRARPTPTGPEPTISARSPSPRVRRRWARSASSAGAAEAQHDDGGDPRADDHRAQLEVVAQSHRGGRERHRDQRDGEHDRGEGIHRVGGEAHAVLPAQRLGGDDGRHHGEQPEVARQRGVRGRRDRQRQQDGEDHADRVGDDEAPLPAATLERAGAAGVGILRRGCQPQERLCGRSRVRVWDHRIVQRPARGLRRLARWNSVVRAQVNCLPAARTSGPPPAPSASAKRLSDWNRV